MYIYACACNLQCVHLIGFQIPSLTSINSFGLFRDVNKCPGDRMRSGATMSHNGSFSMVLGRAGPTNWHRYKFESPSPRRQINNLQT